MSPSRIKVVFSDGIELSDMVEPGVGTSNACGTCMVSSVLCSEDDKKTTVWWNSKPTVWRENKPGSHELLSQHSVELSDGQSLTVITDKGFDKKGKALRDEMKITHVAGSKERG